MGARSRTAWIRGHVSHVHLYLDELRRIESIMRTIDGHEDTLRVSGERHLASTVDDLAGSEHGTVRDLTIERDEPRMSVSVGGKGVIYQAEDSSDLEQQGAIAQILKILEGARSPAILRLLIDPAVATCSLAVMLGVSFPAVILIPRTTIAAALVFVLFPLGTAWLWVTYVVDSTMAAKATLAERGQDAGFLQRNRDDLVLSLISSVVGLITGIAGTLITQAVTSS